MSEPPEIPTLQGQKIPRRMSVEEISFAAHVDYTHNSQFIEMVDANYIVSTPPTKPNLDPRPRRTPPNGPLKIRPPK